MAEPPEMEPFDLSGPLPTGTTLLEASAGTGKTYAVGALVRAGYDWKDGRFPGEQSEPAALKVWGRIDEPPEVGERPGPGEDFPGETGRFGALAMTVWSPLFEAEQGSW